MWHITNVVNFHHEYGGYAYATWPLNALLLKPSDTFKVSLVYDKRNDHPDSERSLMLDDPRKCESIRTFTFPWLSIKTRG